MRNPRALVAILSAALAATLLLCQPAAAARAREGADKALGMAMMSAIVNLDGDLLGGAGATGSKKTATGRYEITFNRSVAGCTYLGGISNNTDGLPFSGAIVALSNTFSADNTVLVNTMNTDGSNFNASAMVMVFCGK